MVSFDMDRRLPYGQLAASWRRFCGISLLFVLALNLGLGGLIPGSSSGTVHTSFYMGGIGDAVADLLPDTRGDSDSTSCHDHNDACVNCVSIPPAEVVATPMRHMEGFLSRSDSPREHFLTLHYKPPRFLQS